MRRLASLVAVVVALGAAADARKTKKSDAGGGTSLDRYIEEALSRVGSAEATAPGSTWTPGSRLADGARDVRGAQVGDVVAILVAERASALARGTTKSVRSSSAKHSIPALGGLTRAAGPLANLADAGGESQLNGEGTTSRETVLTTTLSARVTHVLPNGNLVLEAAKDIQVNSERQIITVRGVVRPIDSSPGNVVRSDRIAFLQVRINGKGVVGDAVRRPFFLYRLLLGLLPF